MGYSFDVTCSCGGDLEHVTSSAYRCDGAEWTTSTKAVAKCRSCRRSWIIRVTLNRA